MKLHPHFVVVHYYLNFFMFYKICIHLIYFISFSSSSIIVISFIFIIIYFFTNYIWFDINFHYGYFIILSF
jgi:hypothetical protein